MTVLPFRTPDEVDTAIPRAVAHLRRGGVLAYPTETVYGLGCRAQEAEVRALAALKGRREDKPFLLLIPDIAMAQRFGLAFNAAAKALARAFWPGPLTLVLPGGEGKLPDSLRGSEGGIAVRWTSHQGIAKLVRHLGEPMTSTSANRAGGPTAPGVEAIARTFSDALEKGTLLILDGGVLGNVPPSTVVDCTTETPRIVREGAIPRSELFRVAGRLVP